jgi:uncharacterized repeat protein (TIGR02059 family)
MIKKILILLYCTINSSLLFSQVTLTVDGTTVNNTETATWNGVNIARNVPTTFTFRNNAISSQNVSGYMLQAGDELVGSTNNNLNGEVITGNKIQWNGVVQGDGTLTHGLFTGYNINAVIKYNYLNNVPSSIQMKSSGMTNTAGGIAYNVINNIGVVAMPIKGMKNVNIFNNTFYSSQVFYQSSTLGVWRGLIDIYANTDEGQDPSVSCSSGTKIKNNIFYTTHQIYNIAIYDNPSLAGFESDYNVFYCEAGTPLFNYLGTSKTFAQWQALGYDKHSVVINPNFTNKNDLIPSARLDYGTDLGSTWLTGLATTATWTVGVAPATADQNGTWQVGARIYNTGTAVVLPIYSSSAIGNSTPAILEMTYNLSLANIVPSVSSFSVMVNSVARAVNSATVSGTKVQLTLASPVVYGDVVTVSYTKPPTNPLQTTSGGQAASISAKAVTNNCLQTIPTYVSSAIQNATPSIVEMTYNLSLANIIPAASAFNVQVSSVARAVSSVAISGTKVQLTLAGPVKFGDVVTVSYTKPASSPLQSSTGGLAANISGQKVTNNLVNPIKDVTPVTVAMTISPNHVHKLLNVVLAYSSTPTASFSPEMIRISDQSGKLFVEQVITTGVTSIKIPLNLSSGIYTVHLLANGVEMATQRIRVYNY